MEILIILIIGYAAYEFLEHVAFPLWGLLVQRKKKAFCGPERLLEEAGEVREWRQGEGFVFVDGELWKAVSGAPLKIGDKVVVQKVEGLIVKVRPANA